MLFGWPRSLAWSRTACMQGLGCVRTGVLPFICCKPFSFRPSPSQITSKSPTFDSVCFPISKRYQQTHRFKVMTLLDRNQWWWCLLGQTREQAKSTSGVETILLLPCPFSQFENCTASRKVIGDFLVTQLKSKDLYTSSYWSQLGAKLPKFCIFKTSILNNSNMNPQWSREPVHNNSRCGTEVWSGGESEENDASRRYESGRGHRQIACCRIWWVRRCVSGDCNIKHPSMTVTSRTREK